MSIGTRPELEPVLRRAFMAPTIAEWTRVLGRSLIVSTTEDDETAAANCAVEVVMSVDGSVRGKVTYTLPAQTVLSIAEATGDRSDEKAGIDPIPAISSFFRPVANRAREMLQASGLGCVVALGRVRDVRGASYSSPVNNPYTVHMVTQPSHNDPASPEPVSLWFDLDAGSASPAPAPQAVGAQRPEARGQAHEEQRAPEPRYAGPAQAAQKTPEARPAAGASASAGNSSFDSGPRGVPAYSPIVRTGRLEIVDETGTARAVVSTLADGSPHIVFADRDGRIRAAISLAKDGQPRILFLDEMGRRILDLPHAGSSTQNAGQQPAQPPQPPQASQPPRRPAPPPAQHGTGQQGSGTRPANPQQPPANRRPDGQTPRRT